MTTRARMRRAVLLVLLWWVLATGPQPLLLERARIPPTRRTHRAPLRQPVTPVAARRRSQLGSEPRRSRKRSA